MMKANAITDVQALVKELARKRSPSAYAEVLSRSSFTDEALQRYCRWNTRHYTRTCIHRDANFELLLICYEPGQCTSVHDYDSQSAVIRAIKGEVVEEQFTILSNGMLRCVSEIHLFPGDASHLRNSSSIHRMTNREGERAITLNLYSKPVSSWKVYDARTGSSRIAPAGPPR